MLNKTGTLYYILIISFLLFLPLQIYAQNTGRIFGKVTDSENGSSLIGVNVLIYTDSIKTASPIAGAATDKNGKYNLLGIPRGEHWLFASYIGYQPKKFKVNIPGNNNSIEFDFSLKATSINIDEVLIEARRDTFRTISTIDISPAFVEKLPSLTGEVDVFRALTLLPGVTTSNELSNGLYVRGGSPDQTLTLIDGVIVYNPFHLGGFASTFNSDAINDIRLVKGAYPAEYGGRLSSVLDITLKEGSKDNFKGKLGLGTISSRLTMEGPISAKSSFLISGRVLYMDALLKQIPKAKNIPLYNFYDMNGKFDYHVSETDRITISGFYTADKLYNQKNSEDAGYNINWNNSTVHLAWLSLSKNKKFTNAALNYTGYSFNTLITDKTPDAFKNDFYSTSSIKDFSFKVDGQYFSNEKHTVKNGIEVTLHNFDLVNNNYFNPLVKEDERFLNKFTSTEIGGYIEDVFEVSPLWTGNAGIRFYYLPDARYFKAEPRISTTYALTESFFVKGAFAMADQFLHLITRNDVVLPTDVWFPSTPHVEPGRSTQGVLGFEYEFNKREFFVSLEGYYRTMQNLYEYSDTATFTIEAPIDEQFARGRGDAYGVEFFLNKRSGGFTGWIGYTLSWTRRYFDDINYGKPFYPRYDRRHDVSVVLTYKLSDSWEFGATWSYATGQAYTMPIGQYYFPGVYSGNEGSPQVFLDYKHINEYRLPAFHKLDVSASYNFRWTGLPLKLTMSVYNVYNRQNPFARYVVFNSSEETGTTTPELKQFTLFPVFPSLSLTVDF